MRRLIVLVIILFLVSILPVSSQKEEYYQTQTKREASSVKEEYVCCATQNKDQPYVYSPQEKCESAGYQVVDTSYCEVPEPSQPPPNECCDFSNRYALFEPWGATTYGFTQVDASYCPPAPIEGLGCYDLSGQEFYQSMSSCASAWGANPPVETVDASYCATAQKPSPTGEKPVAKTAPEQENKVGFFERVKQLFTKKPTRAVREASPTLPIGTPECCATGGYIPAQDGMCAARGYSTVDMGYCAGIPAPVPVSECCDLSSTGGYVGMEINGCVAYGFTAVDPSYCPAQSTKPTPPSPPSGECCQNLQLQCGRVDYVNSEGSALYTGEDACANDGYSTCVVAMYYEYLAGLRIGEASLDVVSQLMTCGENVASWWDGSYSPLTATLGNGHNAAPYAYCCRLVSG
ncbi:hypothetical protein HY488_02660 [Candidatus Woesearchaeota archaeon]|nr:hypothetical protein [Candidatus Woesearchaeota archaeon]